MSNLLQNAIEAAPRDSAITVNEPYKGGLRVLSIHNQGMIPEDIHHNFFGKYVTAGKRNGSGIGTYAAKLMVKVQKGNISFESSEETGTTLYVELPSVY